MATTKTCPKETCQAENKADALYCAHCGAPLDDAARRARLIDRTLSAAFVLLFLFIVGFVAVISHRC